jgi:hypothetical protein
VNARSERTALPLYLTSAVLVVFPAVDLIAQILPFRIGNQHWRFGAVGLFTERLLWPLMGVAIAVITASLLQHTRWLRVLAVLCLVTVLPGLLVLADFALIFAATWGDTQPSARSSLAAITLAAVLKLLIAFTFLSTLAVKAQHTARAVRAQERALAPLLGSTAEPATASR